jgi:hypothetical protein
MDKSRILGVLNSTWGDFNNPTLRENFVYGSALSAAASWELEKIDPQSLLSSFLLHFFQIPDLKLLDTLTNIVWDCANLNNIYRSGPTSMPQVFYMHLFRNPFALDGKPLHYVKKYKKMGEEANRILKQIESVSPQIRYNKKYLEYIQFSLKLVKLLSQKEELSSLSYKLSSSHNSNKIEILKSTLIQKISIFLNELVDIFPEYEQLWVYCALNPVLGFNLMRFRRLNRYCLEKIDQLHQNEFDHDPFLKSEWITSNHVNTPPSGDFYRKIIHLEQKPLKAKLLGIAGTYGRIYINGQYIGQVLSRMSLSILPIQNRVQVFDITEFLQAGPNLIAIESYNFENIESTFNCLIRCKINNQIHDYLSDPSWKVFVGYNPDNPDLNMVTPPESSLQVPNGWNNSLSHEFDAEWPFVSSLGTPPNYNGHIYDEDILAGDVPITEEYFGSKSWLNWAAKTYLGEKLAKYAMYVFKWVKKIIRIA